MTFTSAMEHAVQVFEVVGVAVLLLGLIWAVTVSIYAYRRGQTGRETYRTFREVFGGAILLALEVLVAADLIRSVAIDTTLESVAVLGLIVLIRTFLSFSLEIEIEGMVPWGRAFVSGARVAARATRRATGE